MRLGFYPKDGGNGPTYIRNGGQMYGQMDGCKDGWTDSPCVLQGFIAIGVSAQKHPSSAYFVNERSLLSGHLHECQILFSFYSEMSYILDVIDLRS